MCNSIKSDSTSVKQPSDSTSVKPLPSDSTSVSNSGSKKVTGSANTSVTASKSPSGSTDYKLSAGGSIKVGSSTFSLSGSYGSRSGQSVTAGYSITF